MLANLPLQSINRAKNMHGEKETIATKTLVVLVSDTLETPITARWYKSRSADGASPVYCSVWCHGAAIEACGHGVARGCGYHKLSAAFASALDSAGIKLSTDIDGRGDRAIDDAIRAIGVALGFDGVSLIVG